MHIYMHRSSGMHSMASEEANPRDWGHDGVIINVLQAFSMPLALQQQGNVTIATLRTVCKSWKAACDAAPYAKIK
eukprot:scaffold101918_cov17-Tisochrysis_lutea.AAC.1